MGALSLHMRGLGRLLVLQVVTALLFAGKPWGVWANTTKNLPKLVTQLDVYYLGLDRKKATFNQGTAREQRHTLGINLHGRKNDLFFFVEGDVQFGKFGSGQLRAWKGRSSPRLCLPEGTVSSSAQRARCHFERRQKTCRPRPGDFQSPVSKRTLLRIHGLCKRVPQCNRGSADG
jgi:hypothetical protein